MKKIFLLTALALLFVGNIAAEGLTKRVITYKHKVDWGDVRERYVSITYIGNNLCYCDDGYTRSLLVRTKGSSLADGIFVQFEYPNYPPLSSATGAWLGGYGVEGGPESSVITGENNSSAMLKAEILALNVDLANIFRKQYLSGDERFAMLTLSLFCEFIHSFNKDQLRVLRNTIYANHGYRFKTDDLSEIFTQCEWYKATDSFDEDNFSDKEKVYLTLIKQAEQIAK